MNQTERYRPPRSATLQTSAKILERFRLGSPHAPPTPLLLEPTACLVRPEPARSEHARDCDKIFSVLKKYELPH